VIQDHIDHGASKKQIKPLWSLSSVEKGEMLFNVYYNIKYLLCFLCDSHIVM